MHRPPFIALTLLLAAATAASAQSPQSAGDSPARIRLIPSDPSWTPMTGTLVAFGADTIHLVLDGNSDTVRVLAVDVDHVERSTGRRSSFVRGMLIGALIGGAAGGGAGYAVSSPGGSEPAPYMVPAGIGVGALVGGVIGGLRGASAHRERWETMPTISRDRSASEDPASIGLRVGFLTRMTF
jgi:hypothetical protein